MIPVSHNHAGYPGGIAGPVLLQRMRQQAEQFGTRIIDGTATAITADQAHFLVDAGETLRTKSVLVATGVFNHRPVMDDAVHDAAVASGRLRYCPICDGYEVTDSRVAVVGTGERGTKEALFLRGYTSDLTMVAPVGDHDLDDAQRARLADAGIAIVDGPASDFAIVADGLRFMTADGPMTFAAVYPALGSAIHSELAAALGAKTSAVGCIIVDNHQRTSVPGLYAAGDVVLGLDQISHAMGEGGVAATTIRNDLAEHTPLRREVLVAY